MAFPASAGYGNLPSGNFTPVIYSQKVLKFLRRTSVAEDITNTDYAGEIANYGDTVNIITEPDITVQAYTRGATPTTQNLTDNQIQLIVDKANMFQFAVEDIEMKHSHVNFEELASNRAAYVLKDTFDTEVLNFMATSTLGTKSSTSWTASSMSPSSFQRSTTLVPTRQPLRSLTWLRKLPWLSSGLPMRPTRRELSLQSPARVTWLLLHRSSSLVM